MLSPSVSSSPGSIDPLPLPSVLAEEVDRLRTELDSMTRLARNWQGRCEASEQQHAKDVEQITHLRSVLREIAGMKSGELWTAKFKAEEALK